MMGKHTPGPYEVVRDKQRVFADEVYSEDEIPIALVYADNDQYKANGLLLAAAPDMLAVLERVEWVRAYSYQGDEGQECPFCCHWKEDGRHPVACALAAALAKARGES